jgi:hypothetical protein
MSSSYWRKVNGEPGGAGGTWSVCSSQSSAGEQVNAVRIVVNRGKLGFTAAATHDAPPNTARLQLIDGLTSREAIMVA